VLVLIRRALVASAVVLLLTGCLADAAPTGSAERLVQQSSASAVADSRARDAAQAAAVAHAAEQSRLAAEAAKAAEDARRAAEAAAVQAAAEKAAAEKAAAEKAAADKAAADKAAADKAAADRAAAERAAAAKAAADRASAAARSTRGRTPGPEQPAPAAPRPPAPAAPQPPAPVPASGGSYDAQLLALTNAERTRAGLRPLAGHACATTWAQSWSRHLASTGTLAHQSLSTVLRDCGARGAAENVAYGSSGAAAMVAQWMASPGHRANILSPTATHLGVGAVQRADGRWYGTQVFLTY
jgi:uncharacterized protein YkwD